MSGISQEIAGDCSENDLPAALSRFGGPPA
jgi:hypothetical protein